MLRLFAQGRSRSLSRLLCPNCRLPARAIPQASTAYGCLSTFVAAAGARDGNSRDGRRWCACQHGCHVQASGVLQKRNDEAIRIVRNACKATVISFLLCHVAFSTLSQVAVSYSSWPFPRLVQSTDPFICLCFPDGRNGNPSSSSARSTLERTR